MAAVPTLDYMAITAPLSGDRPGGGRVPLPVRQKLETARKDFEPNPEDPNSPPIPKKPEWSFIIKQSVDVLSQTSKDIETALRLLEALAKQCGFAGAREGFKVLRLLVENCWDFLHPIPDPEDGEGPEIRGDRFNWIGDMDAGARFPHTIRGIPLVKVGKTEYSMQDRQLAFEGKGEISADEMGRATLATDTLAQEVAECVAEFYDLDKALTEKLQNKSPGMVGLRQVLDQILDLVKKMSGHALGGETAVEGGAATPGGGGQSIGGFSINVGSAQNREEIYRMIERLADALATIEPHSPIPDLLKRALKLGRMPFRRLIKELVTDAGHLAQIYREFGIKEEDAAG